MPSLEETYGRSRGGGTRPRLLLGAVLLFVGAFAAGAGLAGVLAGGLRAVGLAEPTAVTLGFATAAMAVPVTGAALLRLVRANRRFRTAGAVGVVLTSLAVAAFVVTGLAERPAGSGGLAVVVWGAYLIGVALALGSPALAVRAGTGDGGTARPTTAFVRDRRPVRPRGGLPSDGGTEDDELAFLLDRDE